MFTRETKMHSSSLNRSVEPQPGWVSPARGTLTSAVAASRGASYLTIQTIVTTVSQALAFAILARIITPNEVGILAVLSLTQALCQAINGSAFSSASTKFVGELSSGPTEASSAVFYQSFRVSLIFSVPISASIFVGAPLLASALLASATQAGLFRVLAVDMLVYSGVLPVAIGTTLGLKRFKESATIGSAGIILRQCLIIVLIIAMRNFVGLVIGWLVSDLAMLAAYGLFILRVLGLPKKPSSFRKLTSFAWPLSIGNVISFAYGWFDRALLISFVSLGSMGVYNAALTAFSALNGINSSVNSALLPTYAGISGRRDLESCRRATWLSSRYASLTLVPFAFGLLATAKLSLTVFVGQAYVGGTASLMILSFILGLTVFASTMSVMLVSLSETRAVMWITVGSVLLGFASAYLLLPIAGITGASIARGVSMVASTCLTILVLRWKKAMRIDVDMVWKTLVAGGLMAGVLVLAQMFSHSKILLPAYVVLGGIVYLAALRMLKAVREHDIELIRKYFGSRLTFVSKTLGVVLVAK
jgi:O-antigen/teichoic acid export membrane protein